MKGLTAPPLLRGCLAVEKKNEKMRENESFLNKLSKIMSNLMSTKSSMGCFIPPNPLQITKRYKIKHYYIGRKWEKHKKLKKSNVADIFVGLQKFATLANLARLLMHLSSGFAFAFFFSKALNCY